MTLGNKLSTLRKQNNITQEQLAELLGVSRQAISKWESDAAYPETEKIIRLSKLYNCSTDFLLKDELEDFNCMFDSKPNDDAGINFNTEQTHSTTPHFNLKDFYYERKSNKTLWGMPLWHVNIGLGRTAKGVFAVGLKSIGIVSMGVLSLGILSFGSLSLGILSAGAFSMGLISAGAIAIGIFAFGAIAFGLLAVGAIAIGGFSIGALSIGQYFALGANANSNMIAIGDEFAYGKVFEKVGKLNSADTEYIVDLMYTNVPKLFHWVVKIIEGWVL